MVQGLTSQEASQLLNQFGPNRIEEQKKRHFFWILFEQFNNFLTILLLVAAGLSFVIGERVDGFLILAIIVLNALFGIYQEKKADEAIAALKKMTVTKIRVIRDGKEIEIDGRELVPGDVIFVEEGVKVPADGQVIETINLEINEAAMTGESLPVVKGENDEVFMGTIVAKGRGYVKITSTGMKTKFGQIASHLSSIDETQTPMQKKLEELSRIIGIAGVIISLVIFGLSLLQGSGYFPAFLLAISLAVAVVPEGLPAVMTITLAIGVKEMAKKKAVIRKLSAIEALGSATLIATDKTGTLTTNKMKVKEIFVDEKTYTDELPELTNHPFSQMILNGILCSTASLVYIHDHGTHDVLGDPTEGALLYLAQEVGIMPEMVRKEWKLVEEVPFDSITKRMSVVVEKDSQKILFVKGAPESILEISNTILMGKKEEPLTSTKRKKIEEVMEKWARKGLRVLAFAYKTDSTGSTDLTDLTFIGLVGIHDPPRLEAKEAILKAKEAGIKVVMITGDNELTAEAIGVSTGLIGENEDIMTGKQIEEYSDQELLSLLPKTRVFARTTPFHKARIVKLYQELGEVVVVTGDGVNDAIALKQADVGVAMGIVGTDVARETADMVITDDNFATIVNAVEEGRNIIKNLRNAIKYLLACNVSEALSLTIGLALGIPHLFYPIQLLYINLVTDGLPALSLAFSPREEHIMKKPPEKKLDLLGIFDKKYILTVGILGTILVLLAYFLFDHDEMRARTAAFSVLALIQSFILVDLWLSHRHILSHIDQLKKPIFLFSFFLPFVAQFVIIFVPSIGRFFNVVPVSLPLYLTFIVLSSWVLIGIRALKKVIK